MVIVANNPSSKQPSHFINLRPHLFNERLHFEMFPGISEYCSRKCWFCWQFGSIYKKHYLLIIKKIDQDSYLKISCWLPLYIWPKKILSTKLCFIWYKFCYKFYFYSRVSEPSLWNFMPACNNLRHIFSLNDYFMHALTKELKSHLLKLNAFFNFFCFFLNFLFLFGARIFNQTTVFWSKWASKWIF